MSDSLLRADCARCAALCCVGLAFDRSSLFAIDKPAGEPCPHLGECHRCRIHSQRAERGFSGCVGYDCFGAGQRVTQELFGGRSWRDEPELLHPMLDAFFALREVHELLVVLRHAGRQPLSVAQRQEHAALEQESLAAVESGDLPGRVRRFLAGLRSAPR